MQMGMFETALLTMHTPVIGGVIKVGHLPICKSNRPNSVFTGRLSAVKICRTMEAIVNITVSNASV